MDEWRWVDAKLIEPAIADAYITFILESRDKLVYPINQWIIITTNDQILNQTGSDRCASEQIVACSCLKLLLWLEINEHEFMLHQKWSK